MRLSTQVGWARDKWHDKFFSDTLPQLATSGFLAPRSCVWLPNLECVQSSIARNRTALEECFVIHPVKDPTLNPLYVATTKAERRLLRCSRPLTNENQLRPIRQRAKNGAVFYALQLRPGFFTPAAEGF